MTTIRVGAALKFVKGREIPPVSPQPTAYVEPTFSFTIDSPKNLPLESQIIETFPLRNHIFFTNGSTQIPNWYVMLDKGKINDFKAYLVKVFAPKDLSGRSDRQMMVPYNVQHIVGDRLVKNPSARIKLVGSSGKGAQDGTKMAESVKTYLVGTWGIAASRIATEGIITSKKPSRN